MGRKSQIIADMSNCYICGNPIVDVHHIFHGIGRKAADKYGYIAPLCRLCHSSLHDGKEQETDLMLKQLAQWHFEENVGSREEFIRAFGRSYL